MKKNILLLFFAIGALFMYTSCEDHRDDYLNEYNTILYFLESGEVPLTIYDTGENANVSVTVNKAGANLGSNSSVYVAKLSEALLSIYNQENGTDYVLLPANCYQFEDQEVVLSSAKPYQVLEVELNTGLINTLPGVDGQYVLPLELLNSNDSLNAKKRHLFLTPQVLTPQVFFPTTIVEDVIFTAESEAQINFSIPVSMSEGLDNKWSFDCEVEIDESLVSEYNEKFGTTYQLLPADSYTMNSTVSFEPGDQTKNVDVTITRQDLRFGNYVLPLRMVSCSKTEFKLDAERSGSVVPITYTPPKPDEIALTAEMLSSNATEPNEGSLAALLDGDVTTFFHSVWSKDVFSPYGHYIDIKLESAIDLAQFEYTTRQNPNGTPKVIELYTSTDGTAWTLLSIINRGLPQTAAANYTSTVMQANQAFSYFRIAVKESAGGKMNETESEFFALSELKFFGQMAN